MQPLRIIRSELLERAGWQCEWCHGTEEHLQVHHGYYARERRDPWDYHESSLFVLCGSCHQKAERARAGIYYAVGTIHPRHHWNVRELLNQVKEAIAEDPRLLEGAQVLQDE